ncbi:hypothetical protein RFI_31051 [Reticulomyxa filosa]|uniref:Uncharacterized protein n=1 Tax=Reticulomyxa filosa TaxID=46433 RepID=X6M032_RETFI|nr:hypothetical protein RFI_31051 [Reticulomyxa filosa]|eukprot:ETO06345.1 hypothetical protein RFI_31051 [Reticulomyxa filosa]
MDSSLVYENILIALQVLLVVSVVLGANLCRDSSNENVQIYLNNHDNMGTTTISWNTFVSYSISQTWKSKMWKYVQCSQFCNKVRRLSFVQFKNSRIRIFKSASMIDPMQSNDSVHTKMPAINIFTSTSNLIEEKKNVHEKKKWILKNKNKKHSDLMASKYITILLVQNKVVRIEYNGLCADVGFCKDSESQFVWVGIRYAGNVELLQLYVVLVQNSVFVPMCPILQC